MKFVKTFENYLKFRPEKIKNLLQHINYFNLNFFSKFDPLVRKMEELNRKIKIENEKPYSEEKYEMQDQLQEMFREYSKGYNKAMTQMVLEYYKKYASDLMSDITDSIKWLSGQNPEETDNRIIYLKSLQKALKRSNIERDWNDEFKNI